MYIWAKKIYTSPSSYYTDVLCVFFIWSLSSFPFYFAFYSLGNNHLIYLIPYINNRYHVYINVIYIYISYSWILHMYLFKTRIFFMNISPRLCVYEYIHVRVFKSIAYPFISSRSREIFCFPYRFNNVLRETNRKKSFF